MSLITTKNQLKELEAKEKELRSSVCNILGENSKAVYLNEGNVWSASWTCQKGRAGVDVEKLKADYPDVYNACLKVGNEIRVLRTGFKSKEELESQKTKKLRSK